MQDEAKGVVLRRLFTGEHSFVNRLLTFDAPSHPVAVAEGAVAHLIWASSYVLVKMGLDYVGPLTAAGLRYFLGALLLFPLMTRSRATYAFPSRLWVRLLWLGLSAYTIGNGALFWSLRYLPATTSSFLMGFLPVLVLVADILWLNEMPTRLQIGGVAVALAGSGLFFSSGLQAGEPLGIGLMAVGLISFTLFAILGREIARDRQVSTLPLTAIPLALGGGLLLLIAVPTEGLLRLPAPAWGIVLWLAVVNTAFAYVLYNHSLQKLTAFEMNIMTNLAPVGTAGLAWLLLRERLTVIQIVGIVVVVIGVILVQLKKTRPRFRITWRGIRVA